MTRDFQQCDILTSVDSDQPVQPPLKLRNSKWCADSSLTQWIFKRLAKALIRLGACAGWSGPLLVAHTTLLEISCRGSIIFSLTKRCLNSLSFMADSVENIITYFIVTECQWKLLQDQIQIFTFFHSMILLFFITSGCRSYHLQVAMINKPSDNRVIWMIFSSHLRGKKYYIIVLFLQDKWLTIFIRPANTCTCPLKAYAIKNIRELYVIWIPRGILPFFH